GVLSVRLSLVLPLYVTHPAIKHFTSVCAPPPVPPSFPAVLSSAPSLELIAPVVLFFTPAVVPVTVTVIVQLAPAATDPPVNVNGLLPLIVRAPPHGVATPFRAVSPAGNVSVMATPVCATVPFGLVR